MLNKMVNSVKECREAKDTTKETSRKLRDTYSNPLGCLVAAFNHIPLMPDGKLPDTWEDDVLCSNPRKAKQEASKEAANNVSKGHEAGISEARPEHMPMVDDYAAFWAVNGPWTMDDALGH